MIPQEDSWEHARRHVTVRIVLRPLRGLLAEHAPQEAYQPLAEIATSESFPSNLAVFAFHPGVQDEADVF